MIDRTVIALLGALIGAVTMLVGSWILVSAYEKMGPWIAVAGGVSVFIALWVVDFLSDFLEKRRRQ